MSLIESLAVLVPADRLITDPLRLLAWGTDASFYRLIPQAVVKVESEEEVQAVLETCRRLAAPVTFRAAGTSLSGQAVTDSVLMVLGDKWDKVVVEKDGAAIRLQPGVIGADANRRLAAFARKIGPDPASIDSAKIGGIAANNSSGMCCGTADNSYQTLDSMRLILADGTLVDTGDAASVARFRTSHAGLLAGISALAAGIGPELSARIAKKFAIKNTTGYALNALVDFHDPVDILQHLMIGSEGTLGFIAEITYRTVPDHAHKASALLFFDTMDQACRTVARLKATPVAAVELMDRAALKCVGQPEAAAALLVETRAAGPAELEANMASIRAVAPAEFTTDPYECAKLWKIRKGTFPAVGAKRKVGTTVIIEDVAFRIEDLAAAATDLQELFATHGYDEAIIFGHALDGNLHFVFTQDFGDAAEVARYGAFMDDVCRLVVAKYDGSLKAEHGTGRNMAPFVEMEWGAEATALMWRIKDLLDPQGLLNPGVVLDKDPQGHLKHLKPLPPADPLVDACIECGFCERMCPSHQMTLSPRQRITGWREISRGEAAGEDTAALRKLYDYQGLDTCAACGLCATACPVGIETGLLTKSLRGRKQNALTKAVAGLASRHYGTALAAARLGLGAAAPLGKYPRPAHLPAVQGAGDVVYVPSCANRLFGPDAGAPEDDSLPQRLVALLDKAGFRVVFPEGLSGLCCGQSFESKGLPDVADAKSAEMAAALRRASDNGRLPILMDASACTLRLKRVLDLPVLDSIEFLHDFVLPRLTIPAKEKSVALHLNCSARRMGLDDKIAAIARACADEVVIPEGVMCCGFAGDKGFTTPELNHHALRKLAVPERCEGGYSSNRTCEIGLSQASAKPYRSIAYLLDRVSVAGPCRNR